MSSPINKSAYPSLFDTSTGYAILAQSGITSAVGHTVTVNNGFYGNAGGSGQITGTFNGTGTLNNAVGSANANLGSLISAINALPTSGTPYNGGPFTFLPGVIYTSIGNIIPSGTLNFNAGSATAQAGNIFWLANSSGLISTASGATIQGNLISGTAITIGGATSSIINGSIFAQGTNVTFAADTIVNAEPVCYLKGTKILTEDGYKNIEDLKVGENVVSKGKIHQNAYVDVNEPLSLKPITWIGSFKAPNLNSNSLPICIKANALRENLPFEDLYVSPGHRIIIDGKMVVARDLINGETIFQDESFILVEYYHFELESHSSVIANGVLSETYLNFNTRGIFEKTETVVELPLVTTPIMV